MTETGSNGSGNPPASVVSPPPHEDIYENVVNLKDGWLSCRFKCNGEDDVIFCYGMLEKLRQIIADYEMKLQFEKLKLKSKILVSSNSMRDKLSQLRVH